MDRDAVEQEFIYPELCQLLKNGDDNTIDYLSVWFDGFTFRWRKRGKHMRQYYGIINPTPRWGFVMFLERTYSRKSDKSVPSFRRILTKKRFKAVFNDSLREHTVEFATIDQEGRRLMDELGITESVQRRISFFKEVKKRIEARVAHRSTDSIDQWL